MPTLPPPPPESELRKGSAITALVLGCLGFVSFGVLGILGAIVGIMSLRRAARSPRKYGGGGMALAGAVLGGLSIPFSVLVLVFGIGLPRADKARLVALETGAMQRVRVLHMAQARYYVQFGRYAGSLEELGPPKTGVTEADSAGLIPAELARGFTAGYRFTLAATPEGYAIHADPIEYRRTGRRSFFSDQSRVLRHNWGSEPAAAGSAIVR